MRRRRRLRDAGRRRGAEVLEPIDGLRTDTFSSYRVAETLHRIGSFDASDASLVTACDSTAAIDALRDGSLPRNYAAVLTRCEVARWKLGLVDAVDPWLVSETVELLSTGTIDDSRTSVGRYDIYTPDVYLFTEPFGDLLGDVWPIGAARAVDLVERVVASNGAGITWGRSSGALAVCLTVELAGLVKVHRLGADGARWVALGDVAAREIRKWFGADGVVNAHQRRSTYAYRGPFRRLQMTLDCLGKLADAAASLRSGLDVLAGEAFADRDELVALERAGRASVWSYRSPATSFVVPFVGATVSDYLPALRNPGLFEVPVDADLPAGVPFVVRGAKRYTAGGRAADVRHDRGSLTVRHDGWVLTNRLESTADDEAATLPGARVATYRVDGRTVSVTERLTFDDKVPHAIALQVAEAAERPLRVRFGLAPGTTGAATTMDTSGMKEWRSYWGELPRVHQLDLDPAAEVAFEWSVTPKVRVLSTGHEHHYHRTLYDPLVRDDLVVDARIALGRVDDRRYVDELLGRFDVFHLHWPEWFLGADLDRHRRFVDALRDGGVRVVWTQHNLVPHDRDPRLVDVYALWASVADVALHHSDAGRRRVVERYRFAPSVVHAMVPHPHFGPVGHSGRATTRAADGLLRLGVIGAPRPEKDVQLVLDAVAACARDDVRLEVWSLAGDERVPDDPRITAERYVMVDRGEYERRLSTLDAIVFPFGDGGELLTTGTVGDAVAHGLPALTSEWAYLGEALGDAAIGFRSTVADLAALLDDLTPARLAAAAAASRALQPALAAEAVAQQLYAVLDKLPAKG